MRVLITASLGYDEGVSDVDIRALIDFLKRHGNLCTTTAVLPPLPGTRPRRERQREVASTAHRVGDAFAACWERPCPVGIDSVLETSEPHLRIGLDRVEWADHGLDEEAFWDEYAEYYASRVLAVQG